MTYTSGSLILATDYNGFVSTNVNANVNDVWGTGSGDKGWGQTPIGTVSAAGTITATQWASLVNTLSTMGSQTGTAITSRTAPTAGNTIEILSNLNTDLTNINTNRGNAVAVGSQYTSWTGTSAKTSATGSGSTAWTITFTHTVTWASANACRAFFNAGGLIKCQFGKSSTGQLADAEWNDLASTLCGSIFISGRVNGAAQTIAGTSYTGTTKVGGTGTPNTLTTTTGYYNFTTSDTLIYKQFADTAPYTGQFIALNAKTAGTGTQLVLTTTWTDPGASGAGSSDVISGGTDSSGVTFGTAPATIVTYLPPSTTYLTNSWGTPTVVASVA
jgi:hypothetical protein